MKKRFGLLALVLVAFSVSCSKETSEPDLGVPVVQETSHDGPLIRLSGGVALDGARSLQHTLNESTAEMLYETDFDEVAYKAALASGEFNKWHKLEGAEIDRFVKQIPIRERKKRKLSVSLVGSRMQVLCVIKSDNPTQPTTYAYVPVHNVGDKSFELDTSVDIQLAPGTNLMQDNWSIMGFVYSSGKSSGQTIGFDAASRRLEIKAPSSPFTATEYDASTATGTLFTPPTLYMFSWVPLTIETISSGSGTELRGKMSTRARLEPQGALYVQEIANDGLLPLPREEDFIAYIGEPYINDGTTPPIPEVNPYVDAAENPLYGSYNGLVVDLNPSAGAPSGALDGYYDLSASKLSVAQAPVLEMGTTHRLELKQPEVRYYYKDRYQEKPRYWASVLMVPNQNTGATHMEASITPSLGHLWPASIPENGEYHAGPLSPMHGGPIPVEPLLWHPVFMQGFGFSGRPKHGSVIYKQLHWGYVFFGRGAY